VIIPFRLALCLAALFGFIALAHEIIWTRIYNFVSGSSAQALGMLLGSYLLGLALGSLWSRRWQEGRAGEKPGLRTLARLFVISNVAAFLVVPAVSWLVVRYEWPHTLPLVMAAAALLGAGFPLLCHLAIPPDQDSGARLSYLYLANIIGSGAGSLLTGFVLMEWLALWQIAALLLGLALLIGILTSRRSGPAPRRDILLWGLSLVLAGCAPLLYRHLYDRLQYKQEYFQRPHFTEVIESRHGVITIENNRVIYGNGIYDGMIETNPRKGGGLIRPFFISAVHAAPRDVLVIGMSGGAWTKILAHNPDVERITVVEISEGYLKLIANHPEVADVLTDPKVTIVIDDGRRWIRRNPGRQFDLIVMNTTFNWREFASALLGREFLELAKTRLQPGGIVMWNCTGSGRAINTGMSVFPHTLMIANNCVASTAPLVIDPQRWRRILIAYQLDGRPVYDPGTAEGRTSLEQMLAIATDSATFQANIMTRDAMEKLYGHEELITDDNMGHEYKFTLKDTARLKKLLLPFLD